jgi:hypothetical protein
MRSFHLLVLVLATVSETVSHTLKTEILKFGIFDNVLAKLKIFTTLKKHFNTFTTLPPRAFDGLNQFTSAHGLKM